MCSGTIASHGCKLRDPWEQLSIATIVLEMGKLRHGGEGGCAELANPKSRKVHLLAPVLPTCPLAPSAASSPALRLPRVYLD